MTSETMTRSSLPGRRAALLALVCAALFCCFAGSAASAQANPMWSYAGTETPLGDYNSGAEWFESNADFHWSQGGVAAYFGAHLGGGAWNENGLGTGEMFEADVTWAGPPGWQPACGQEVSFPHVPGEIKLVAPNEIEISDVAIHFNYKDCEGVHSEFTATGTLHGEIENAPWGSQINLLPEGMYVGAQQLWLYGTIPMEGVSVIF